MMPWTTLLYLLTLDVFSWYFNAPKIINYLAKAISVAQCKMLHSNHDRFILHPCLLLNNCDQLQIFSSILYLNAKIGVSPSVFKVFQKTGINSTGPKVFINYYLISCCEKGTHCFLYFWKISSFRHASHFIQIAIFLHVTIS